jgi:diguanylate cyclase (GGDEF)-like protein
MQTALVHEIELYSPVAFKTLLDHEVNRSRRYGEPLALVHISLETEPDDPQTQHSAEVFTINALNLRLRETDIPCRQGDEFLVLMPSTDETGARVACDRLERLLNAEPQMYDRISFKLSVFIGMVTLPGDPALSSKKLLEGAAAAMKYARVNRMNNTMNFSEMEH